jgi:gliding motility-associated-like protein
MIKNLIRIMAMCLIGIILKPETGNASHIAAGDISYTYTGSPNTFLVKLRLYRDCAGITMDPTETICYTSASCNINQTLTVNLLPGSGQEIPPTPCVPASGPTTCSGGTGYGVQEYIYQAVLVMPAQCLDWKFQWEVCCRNNNVTNLANASGLGMYLEATMNNLDYPTNSSPYFNSIPVTQFCVNNQFYFDQGAIDPDNDSLQFSLIGAQDASGSCPMTPTTLTYNAPLSGSNPVASVNGTTINVNTGVISFLPNTIQTPVIAIRCYEYDRVTGALKTIVKRELQINIVATCIIATPSFDSTLVANGLNFVTGVNNVTCHDTVFYIVVNPSIQCGSIVPSDIRMLNPNGTPNPVVSATGVNCTNGLTDSIRVSVLNPIQGGTSALFTKIGNDGNTFLSECGSPMNEFDTLFINLYDSANYAFNLTDTLDCTFDHINITSNQLIDCFSIAADGSDFIIVDANGTNIPVTGATCTGINGGHFGNQFVLTTQSTSNAVSPLTVIVHNGSDLNTMANGCGTLILENDTIGTIYVRSTLDVNLGTDITVCSSDPTPQLNAGYFDGATYEWTLNGTIIQGQNTQTIPATTTGQYIVNIQTSASCSGADTVQVNIIAAPIVNLGNDIHLCASDPFPTLDAGNPGATYQWYQNNTAIAGATTQQYTPTAAGTYFVEVNIGASCLGRDTVEVTVEQQLSITMSDLSYCSGNSVTLQSSSPNTGVNYNWTLNGTAIQGQNGSSVPVTGSGVYEVTITAGSCSANATANVTEVEQPSATLSNIAQCDNVTAPVLDPGYTASAGNNTVFNWTFNNSNVGGNSSTLNTASTGAGNYAVTITNTVNGFTCTANASMALTINAAPAVGLGNDIVQCTGDNPATLSTANGNGYTFQWTLNNNPIGDATDSSITASSAGTYAVIVTNASGCTSTDNVVVSINALPSPLIQDEMQRQDSIPFCMTQSPAPVLTLVNNAFIQSYQWALNGENISTNANVTVAAIGEYKVTVVDSNGCRNSDVIQVFEIPCEVEVYNVITPNNDGKNDVFEVKNLLDFPVRKLTVFNRWGKKVYSANPYNNDWNGGNLAAGVYYFILEYDNGVKSETKKGSFNLIR